MKTILQMLLSLESAAKNSNGTVKIAKAAKVVSFKEVLEMVKKHLSSENGQADATQDTLSDLIEEIEKDPILEKVKSIDTEKTEDSPTDKGGKRDDEVQDAKLFDNGKNGEKEKQMKTDRTEFDSSSNVNSRKASRETHTLQGFNDAKLKTRTIDHDMNKDVSYKIKPDSSSNVNSRKASREIRAEITNTREFKRSEAIEGKHDGDIKYGKSGDLKPESLGKKAEIPQKKSRVPTNLARQSVRSPRESRKEIHDRIGRNERSNIKKSVYHHSEINKNVLKDHPQISVSNGRDLSYRETESIKNSEIIEDAFDLKSHGDEFKSIGNSMRFADHDARIHKKQKAPKTNVDFPKREVYNPKSSGDTIDWESILAQNRTPNFEKSEKDFSKNRENIKSTAGKSRVDLNVPVGSHLKPEKSERDPNVKPETSKGMESIETASIKVEKPEKIQNVEPKDPVKVDQISRNTEDKIDVHPLDREVVEISSKDVFVDLSKVIEEITVKIKDVKSVVEKLVVRRNIIKGSKSMKRFPVWKTNISVKSMTLEYERSEPRVMEKTESERRLKEIVESTRTEISKFRREFTEKMGKSVYRKIDTHVFKDSPRDVEIPVDRVSSRGVLESKSTENELLESNIRKIQSTLDEVVSRMDRGSVREKATVQLEPPRLGRVEIEIIKEDDRLRIEFRVSNPEVKDVLEKKLESLTSRLESGGFNVEKIEVRFEKFEDNSRYREENDENTKDQGEYESSDEREEKRRRQRFQRILNWERGDER